jgi:hypothetical protein
MSKYLENDIDENFLNDIKKDNAYQKKAFTTMIGRGYKAHEEAIKLREKTKKILIEKIPEEFKNNKELLKKINNYEIGNIRSFNKWIVEHSKEGKEEIKTVTKKSKKTIEVDEKGTIIPRGFTEKEKDIIRKIDHNIYSPETIIQIIKDIASKKVKSPKDFPKADYGESEEEEEEEEIPEEKPKKGTHGGFRANAGRKKTPVEEIKEEPKEKEIPISVIKKKPGKKSKYTEAEKAKMAADKAKAKERKRIANLKPYFKADEPTKGFREASMMEAADANKIMLWGKKKADAKVIKEQFDKGKTLKPKRLEMMSKIARMRGRLDRLKREMEDPKITFKDKADKAGEFESLRKQLLVLYDEYKKMDNKPEPDETGETKPAKKPTKKSIKKTE